MIFYFVKLFPLRRICLVQELKTEVALVTGAAGSIGRELSLQILSLKPSKLIVVDFSEPNLFELKNLLIKNNFQ